MTGFKSALAGFCLAAFSLSLVTDVVAEGLPNYARKGLSRLVGEWSIESKLGNRMSKAEIKIAWTANKEGLIWHWKGTDVVSGQVATSVGLIGWNGQQQAIVEHTISSNGVTFSSTIQIAGNRWTSPTRGTELIDGEYKTSLSRRVIEWASNDKFIIISQQQRLSGKPQPDVTSVFTRNK